MSELYDQAAEAEAEAASVSPSWAAVRWPAFERNLAAMEADLADVPTWAQLAPYYGNGKAEA